MVELAVRALSDLGLSRRRALVLVGVLGVAGGVPSALSIDFFHNQDWVWSTALVVSGLLFSVVVLKYGVDRFRQRYVNLDHHQLQIGRWWNVVVAALVPAQAVALLAWFLLGTLPNEGTWSARLAEWLNPWSLENTGTVLLQWAVLLAVLVAANRWLYTRAQQVSALSPRDD